jgi:hypothetical protein
MAAPRISFSLPRPTPPIASYLAVDLSPRVALREVKCLRLGKDAFAELIGRHADVKRRLERQRRKLALVHSIGAASRGSRWRATQSSSSSSSSSSSHSSSSDDDDGGNEGKGEKESEVLWSGLLSAPSKTRHVEDDAGVDRKSACTALTIVAPAPSASQAEFIEARRKLKQTIASPSTSSSARTHSTASSSFSSSDTPRAGSPSDDDASAQACQQAVTSNEHLATATVTAAVTVEAGTEPEPEPVHDDSVGSDDTHVGDDINDEAEIYDTVQAI